MSGDPLVWQGKFLEVRRAGHWEYAGRKGQTAAVVVLAIDDERHVLLVEQERPPLGGRALELPAGLVGDEEAGETVAAAAARELHEECGYRADRFVALGSFASSPGMISETFNLVRATGLRRDGAGGGVAGEDITVHRVALDRVAAFVEERRAAGVAIDSKLLMLLAGAWL